MPQAQVKQSKAVAPKPKASLPIAAKLLEEMGGAGL